MNIQIDKNIKCTYTGFVCHRLKKEDSEFCSMHFDAINTKSICSYISDETGKRCLLPLNRKDELQTRFCHMHNKSCENYLVKKFVPESYLNIFKPVFSNTPKFKDPRFSDFDPTLLRSLPHDIMKCEIDPEYFSLNDPIPVDDVLTDEEYHKKQIFHTKRTLEAWKVQIASVEQQKQKLENRYKELKVNGKFKNKMTKKRDKAYFQNGIYSKKDVKLINKIKKLKSSNRRKGLSNNCKYELDGIRCKEKAPEFLNYCCMHFSKNFDQSNFFYDGCLEKSDEYFSTEKSCFKSSNGNKSLNQSSLYKDEIFRLMQKLDNGVEKLDMISSCGQKEACSCIDEEKNKNLKIDSSQNKNDFLLDKEKRLYYNNDILYSNSSSSTCSLAEVEMESIDKTMNVNFCSNNDLDSKSNKSSDVSSITDIGSLTELPKVNNLDVIPQSYPERIKLPKKTVHTTGINNNSTKDKVFDV